MKKIKYIFQGFLNFFLSKIGITKKDTDYYHMVKERQKICIECSYHSPRIGICKICGCYCRAKASAIYDIDNNGKSIDGCPLKKW